MAKQNPVARDLTVAGIEPDILKVDTVGASYKQGLALKLMRSQEDQVVETANGYRGQLDAKTQHYERNEDDAPMQHRHHRNAHQHNTGNEKTNTPGVVGRPVPPLRIDQHLGDTNPEKQTRVGRELGTIRESLPAQHTQQKRRG